MAEFCSCGSLKIRGSCTNKKCAHHNSATESVSFAQIEYIRGMLGRLHDDTEYDFDEMTVKEASKLIDELKDRLEVGE